MDRYIKEKRIEDEYVHTLRNRIMALRAKIEDRPKAGQLVFQYDEDYYQEETRSIGIRMIREGYNEEGEKLIVDFTREHYPDYTKHETKWVSKMMRYLNVFSDTLIDNLRGEGFVALQSNTDLPNENALFYPIFSRAQSRSTDLQLGLMTVVLLDEIKNGDNFEGLLYYKSELTSGNTFRVRPGPTT